MLFEQNPIVRFGLGTASVLLAFGTATCAAADAPPGRAGASEVSSTGGRANSPTSGVGAGGGAAGPAVAAPAVVTPTAPVINIAGSSGGGGQPNMTCSAEGREGERVPVDMYFLVDSSSSMADIVQGGTRWSAVSNALVGFLRDPQNADLGVALGYLPYVDAGSCVMGDPLCLCLLGICVPLSPTLASCEVTDYSKPTIPFSLPSNVAALASDLLARQLNGGTPTRPALEGAVQYLSTWATAHPERKPVMVLATDGEPFGCTGNTPQDVATVAAAGLAVGIQTFVIGVGKSLDSLHLVARAGGTGQAFLVEDANAATAFADALARIRNVSVPCDFLIPAQGEQGKIDPDKVNVKYTPTGATSSVLVAKTHDGADTGCSADGGWYYDDPASPTTIKLCPTTCSSLEGGSIQVEYGCKTVVQPLR
ncbi:MAG: VWA domain-containing protein [Myxococcota bacterium]|nr:VWA domain-containing protein [Myxococcota bacterium]